MLFVKIYCSALMEQILVHISLIALRVIKRHGLLIGFGSGMEAKRFCRF